MSDKEAFKLTLDVYIAEYMENLERQKKEIEDKQSEIRCKIKKIMEVKNDIRAET